MVGLGRARVCGGREKVTKQVVNNLEEATKKFAELNQILKETRSRTVLNHLVHKVCEAELTASGAVMRQLSKQGGDMARGRISTVLGPAERLLVKTNEVCDIASEDVA